MAADNPNALTWIFSYQVADPADASPEVAILKPVADVSWIQYFAFHVTENLSTDSVYIRGIIRCYRPRSTLQLKSILPYGSFKPLRGMFTPAVVADKLRPTNRIGDLYEYGLISTAGAKRSFECSGLCRSCCLVNKRLNL